MGFALQKVSTKVEVAPKSKMVNFQSMAVVKEAATPRRQELPAKVREIATERLMFCKEVYALTQSGSNQEEAVNVAATKAGMYPRLVKAGRNGASTLNLYNYRGWMKRLGKTRSGAPDFRNVDALSNRYCLDVRGAKGAAEFWKAFNSFYLNENKFSLCKAYDMAKKLCLSNGISPVPSERQTRYWMETHADRAAVMAARHGEVWAENHIMSYIRRDWSAVTPNECWIGDHHIFDAPVKVWNEEKETWEAMRPWLTGWLDAKTLRFTGVHIGVDNPNSAKILIALQNGIRLNDNVAPQMLYNDNGKDYLKTGFTEEFIPKDTDSKHSIANELGMKCLNSLPYNARAKTIERMFGEVCSKFSKIWAAYLGNRPDARPEIAGFFWSNPEHLPTLGEFCEAFATWLQDDFHAKKQNGKILEGKSPAEAWTRGSGGMRLSDEDLWFSMLLPYTRNCPKVARGAAVSVDGKEYRADGLWEYYGQKIMVKQDVVNGGAPQAFTLDGRHICALEPVAKIAALAKSEAERKMIGTEMKRQRRELKRAFGIADEMSNGMRRVAAQELMLLKPGADVKLTKYKASGKSVKGGSHHFTLVSASGGETEAENEKPDDAADEATPRELTRGQEKAAKFADFGKEVTGSDEADTEISPEMMADFHKQIVNSEQRREYDDEESWD